VRRCTSRMQHTSSTVLACTGDITYSRGHAAFPVTSCTPVGPSGPCAAAAAAHDVALPVALALQLLRHHAVIRATLCQHPSYNCCRTNQQRPAPQSW
jgi:hypothetical protein